MDHVRVGGDAINRPLLTAPLFQHLNQFFFFYKKHLNHLPFATRPRCGWFFFLGLGPMGAKKKKTLGPASALLAPMAAWCPFQREDVTL